MRAHVPRTVPTLVVLRVHLICFVLLSIFTTTSTAAERVALVVGNSVYRAAPGLVNPSRDAPLIADRLRGLDFQTVVLMDINLRQFKTAISEFTASIAKAGPETVAVFYFAGHGVQIDGTNYLIPIDAEVSSASDVVLNAVSVGDLLKTLELAQAQANIVILDACRDNPFKSGTRGVGRGLAQMSAPPGSLVAYATAPGYTASDGTGVNSPYAKALADNIVSAGLSIEEVFKRVRIDVNRETGGTQTPWEETSLTIDLRLAGGVANAPPQPVPSEPQVETLGDKGNKLVIEAAYLQAVATNTIEGYHEFIKSFSKSDRASDALNNLRMLTDEQSWLEVTRQNTASSYAFYIAVHPNGTHVDDARTRIEEMQRAKEPAPPLAEAPQVDIPSSPTSTVRGLVERRGFDVYGFDLRTIKNTTYDDCVAACQSSSSCKALTFNRAARRCFLKSGADILMRNADADAAHIRELDGSIRVSSITVMTKTDFEGYDYNNIEAVDFGTCFVACENDQRCRAFSFVRKKRSCWLKAYVGPKKVNARVDSGLR